MEGRPGRPLERFGDEIVVCGRLFHTGTRVILWTDQFGYDAYRVEPRFRLPESADASASRPAIDALNSTSQPTSGPTSRSAKKPPAPEEPRYGTWRKNVSPELMAELRENGWSLEELQQYVDLFVLHYDVCGTSRNCFKVLQDDRHLSVHFMLDVDGTIYQTLDLKERAWHASEFNDRSVGVEIANIGAYPVTLAPEFSERAARYPLPFAATELGLHAVPLPKQLDDWYDDDLIFGPRVVFPKWMTKTGIRTENFVARPARRSPVLGRIHGRMMMQYDFTNEQYRALAKLTATLCTVLPRIKLQFPRDAENHVYMRDLSNAELADFHGVLGHFHLTKNKQDPGPAFDWERLQRTASWEMR